MVLRPVRPAHLLAHLLPLAVMVVGGATAATAAKPRAGDRVTQLLERGHAAMERENAERALTAFTKANAEAGGGSVPALLGIAWAQLRLGRYDETAAAARRVIELAPEGELAGRAANLLGVALYQHWNLGLDNVTPREVVRRRHQYYRRGPPVPGPELLEEAERSFRRALELVPGDAAAPIRANLVKVLEGLGRCRDARAVIDEHLAQGGNPELARHFHFCPVAPPGAKEPERVGGEVTRPEKIAGLNPLYPGLARMFHVEGIVILEAIIDVEGRVCCAHPLQRLPLGLTESALEALRSWRFKPARLGGEPVAVYYTLTVSFSIGD